MTDYGLGEMVDDIKESVLDALKADCHFRGPGLEFESGYLLHIPRIGEHICRRGKCYRVTDVEYDETYSYQGNRQRVDITVELAE